MTFSKTKIAIACNLLGLGGSGKLGILTHRRAKRRRRHLTKKMEKTDCVFVREASGPRPRALPSKAIPGFSASVGLGFGLIDTCPSRSTDRDTTVRPLDGAV